MSPNSPCARSTISAPFHVVSFRLQWPADNPDLPGHCLYASGALFEIEKRQRELGGVIVRHERELAALESQAKVPAW